MKDRIQNTELRRSGMEDADSRAHLTKWRWAGHIARMDQERWTYAATVWDARFGGRSRGQPRPRWAQEFEMAVGAHWTMTAKDREKWKATSSLKVLVIVPPVAERRTRDLYRLSSREFAHPMSPTELALLDCRRPLPLGDVIRLTLTL
jgi:hypothetical protein